jgi:hypothetical protein
MDDPEMMKAAEAYAPEALTPGGVGRRSDAIRAFCAGWKARASAEDGVLTEAEQARLDEIGMDFLEGCVTADGNGSLQWHENAALKCYEAMRAALSRIRTEGSNER